MIQVQDEVRPIDSSQCSAQIADRRPEPLLPPMSEVCGVILFTRSGHTDQVSRQGHVTEDGQCFDERGPVQALRS
jgi:hypothetical protein